jgi:hypothetical protein
VKILPFLNAAYRVQYEHRKVARSDTPVKEGLKGPRSGILSEKSRSGWRGNRVLTCLTAVVYVLTALFELVAAASWTCWEAITYPGRQGGMAWPTHFAVPRNKADAI